jgi:hypothetical protein
MDSKAFFNYSVEYQIFEKETIINAKIDSVKLQGEFAQAKMKFDGQEVTFATWQIFLSTFTVRSA